MSERSGELQLFNPSLKAHVPVKFLGSSSILKRPSLNKIPLRNNRVSERFRFSLNLSSALKTEEATTEEKDLSSHRALPSAGSRPSVQKSLITSVEGDSKELPVRKIRSQSVPKLTGLTNDLKIESRLRTKTLHTTADCLHITKMRPTSSSSLQEKFKFNLQQRPTSKHQDLKQKGSQSQRTLSANIKKGFLSTTRSKLFDVTRLSSARKSEEPSDITLSLERQKSLMHLIKETKDSVVKDKTVITNIVDKQFHELDALHEKYLKRNNNMKWAIATLGKTPKTQFIRFFTSTKAGFIFCQQKILSADIEL
jgi:hypothetical protein